jgi:hypothetical protein
LKYKRKDEFIYLLHFTITILLTLFIYSFITFSHKNLQIGIRRFREFAESTYQFPSTIACKELRDIIEYKRWNKGDGASNIQEHCTANEFKECEFGFIKALHHIIRDTAFNRWRHRFEVFYVEQWLYEPSKTFATLDERLVHYER